MNKFKNFLVNWNSMCINPTGNTIILSKLDNYFIEEIKNNLSNFITETDTYYIIKYMGNTIAIEK
jgi:hypothetical protein